MAANVAEEIRAGAISKVVADKGFGFIQPDMPIGSQPVADLFFHAASVVPRESFDLLKAGVRVVYRLQISERDNKLRAGDVRLPTLEIRVNEKPEIISAD